MRDTDQQLDEIVTQIRAEAVPSFPREQLASRFSEQQSRGDLKDVRPGIASARKFRKLIATGTLAASLLILATWLVSVINTGTAFAFADVKEALNAARTIRYRVLHYSQDPNYLRQYKLRAGEPAISQVTCSGNRIRNEAPLGIVTVVDFDKGLAMASWASTRTAVIEPAPKGEGRKAAADFRAMLLDVSANSAKRLPDRTENGRTVSEFLVRMREQDFTVTVDPQTKLPIRIEMVRPRNLEQGRIVEMREICTDFVFDAPVDESLLRIEAPAGYTVESRIPPNTAAQPPESMDLTVSAEDGIGPVKFGDKVADIVRLLGEPDWRREIPGMATIPNNKPGTKPTVAGATVLDYHRRGFDVFVDERRGMYVVHCKGMGDAVFRGRTKEGIALGASWDEVLEVYGKPEAELPSLAMFYPKRGYEFQFRDGKLVAIQVMRPNPAVVVEAQPDGTIRQRFVPVQRRDAN